MTITRNHVFQIVERNTYEVVPELAPGDFARADSLRDLGADSLDRAEILNLSLEELDLQTPMHQFASVQTIAELVDALWNQTKT